MIYPYWIVRSSAKGKWSHCKGISVSKAHSKNWSRCFYKHASETNFYISSRSRRYGLVKKELINFDNYIDII